MFKRRVAIDRRYTEVGGCLLNFHSDSTNKLRSSGGDTGPTDDGNKKRRMGEKEEKEESDRAAVRRSKGELDHDSRRERR